MAVSRSAKVQQAVQAIRDFHALGREIPPKVSPKDAYDKGVIEGLAEEKGINEDTIRKARAFADPVAGYTAVELDELCGLIEADRPDHEQSWSIFRQSHVIRLLSVPKRHRKALQTQVIKKGWSKGRLDVEIAKRFGTRRAGGRKPTGAKTVEDWLAQAEKMCEKWRRWNAALDDPDRDDQVGRKHLPPKLRDALLAASAKVGLLKAAVEEELARTPGRSPRIAPGS